MARSRKPSVSLRTFEPLCNYVKRSYAIHQIAQATIFGMELAIETDERLTHEKRRALAARDWRAVFPLMEWDGMVELSQTQAREGFSLVYEQATIGLVGALEVTISDFARLWLRDHPAARETEQVRQIVVPISEYENMSRDERAAYLRSELQVRLQSSRSGVRAKPGIEPHQRLLGATGLQVPVEPAMTRDIMEMCACRNQLVHHGGKVDRAFIELCPWLQARLGRRIRLSSEQWDRFFNSTEDYVEAVFYAAADAAGVDYAWEQ